MLEATSSYSSVSKFAMWTSSIPSGLSERAGWDSSSEPYRRFNELRERKPLSTTSSPASNPLDGKHPFIEMNISLPRPATVRKLLDPALRDGGMPCPRPRITW